MGELTARGHELTAEPGEADAIVVNTCSFIDPAKQESVDTILEMAEFKKRGKAKRLIVAGCLVERYRGDIQAQIPEVDAVVGTNELESIVAVCEEGRSGDGTAAPYLYHEGTPRVLATPRHYAYVKINEGCDHPCTFCVIPQFRGRFRSRRFESVAAEAKRLFDQGVREINLIGQDTTAYGDDLGLEDGLAHLLARLAGIETPHRKWVRFLYCYPNRITNRLLETIASHEPLVKYLDMPLQHASARVLKRMKRGASGEIFLRLLEKVRRIVPGVTIRTSMIVGFPGETDADFQELMEFVQAARFDRLGVFSYSDEETAESYHLDGKVSRREIYHRRRALMAAQKKISRAANKHLVGQEVDVLLEGPTADSEMVWQARMAGQAPDIDGVCYVGDFGEGTPARGQIRRMRITKAYDYDLVGDLVDSAPEEAQAAVNPFPIISSAAGRPRRHQ